MTETASSPKESVRTAEVIAAVSLATDLGMGFPFEHGLHSTLMAMRLCDLLDVDEDRFRGSVSEGGGGVQFRLVRRHARVSPLD